MQSSFFNSGGVYRFSHGGLLRQKKRGRGERALSTKEPLHAVFKIERLRLRQKSLCAPQSFEKEELLATVMTHTPPARSSQD